MFWHLEFIPTIIIPPPNEVGGGVYWIHLVRPSVCRRHGFRSISQVCFGISISNFIYMLMVAIGRSLALPCWVFWHQCATAMLVAQPLLSGVSESPGTSTFNWLWAGENRAMSIRLFVSALLWAVYPGIWGLLIFSDVTFKMAAWWPYWIFWFPDSNFTLALNINFKLQRDNTYVYG